MNAEGKRKMEFNDKNTTMSDRDTSLTKIYDSLQLLPWQITHLIEEFDRKMTDEKNAFDEAINSNRAVKSKEDRDLTNDIGRKQSELKAQKDAQIKERAALQARNAKIIEEMKEANRDYLWYGDLLQHKNAKGKLYSAILEIMRNHDRILNEYEELKKEVETQIDRFVDEAYFEEEIAQINREKNEKDSEINSKFVHKWKTIEEDHTRSVDRIKKELLDKIESFNPKRIETNREKCLLQVPLNEGFQLVKTMPETVCLATCVLDLTRVGGNENKKEATNAISQYFSYGTEMRKGRKYLTFPFGQSFSSDSFNKILEYDFESREMALEYLSAMEMRMFQSIPAGKLRVTMFDPIDLGKNFSMFSVLGDYDDRIINTQIWHETDRMKEKLKDLVAQISHVNQDCLKGVYTNIVDYNKAVGKNAEPLQALFIADFSDQFFDLESCRLLNQIIRSGPKCGVFCFIAGNHEAIELGLGTETIMKLDKFVFKQGHMTLQSSGKTDLEMIPISLPTMNERKEILQMLNEGIEKSERIIIDFDEASDNLLQHKEKWFQFMPNYEGIAIPIGIEGANKKVEIGFGGVDRTQHHMLVSGTTGAGKSTFLHTFIMSTLLHFSPEDVQIYLLDFKKGVEFKIYSEYQLPNFKVISTDTTPEYGLAVLKHLCEEQARTESTLFKNDNLTLIEEYNDRYPNKKISRKILIIDEFHEMFVNSESAVAKECHYYLQQLVKQGRAWGLYVVLASQKLPESCTDIYHQMLNRVALQSTEDVAKMILDSDNPGVNQLVNMDAGSGIFNDNGGHKDANRIFRVAYFKKELLKDTLQQIKERQKNLGYDRILDEENDVILDVNSLSDAKKHPLTRFVKNGVLPTEKTFGYPLYFAKSLSLNEEFEMRLCADDGQNLLIAGPEDNRVKRILGISVMSILLHSIVGNNGKLPNTPIITYFDFSNNRKSFGTYDILNELAACYPQQIRVFGKDTVLPAIEQLEKELEEETFERHFVIFAGLNRAKKLLSSRTYEASPRDRLVKMIEKGPEKGVNFLIWANEPESFLEFYADTLDSFDYRIGYALQEDTFKKLFLSAYVDIGDDNNAISYSADDGNMKIRIYDAPLKDYVDGFINQVDSRLDEEGEFDE